MLHNVQLIWQFWLSYVRFQNIGRQRGLSEAPSSHLPIFWLTASFSENAVSIRDRQNKTMKLVAGIKELTGKLLFRGFRKATCVKKGSKASFYLNELAWTWKSQDLFPKGAEKASVALSGPQFLTRFQLNLRSEASLWIQSPKIASRWFSRESKTIW